MNNKHIGIHNSVFRVGVVYSVNGREVEKTVKLTPKKRRKLTP